MFLDCYNQHHQNVSITESHIQNQCDLNKNTNIVFSELKKITQKFIWIVQAILKNKNKAG